MSSPDLCTVVSICCANISNSLGSFNSRSELELKPSLASVYLLCIFDALKIYRSTPGPRSFHVLYGASLMQRCYKEAKRQCNGLEKTNGQVTKGKPRCKSAKLGNICAANRNHSAMVWRIKQVPDRFTWKIQKKITCIKNASQRFQTVSLRRSKSGLKMHSIAKVSQAKRQVHLMRSKKASAHTCSLHRRCTT